MSNCLEGRTGVVFGVANKRSIAWAIAQQMQQAGAQLAITYQNERLKQEADDLIAALPNAQAFQCDVSRDEEIAQLFEQLKSRYGKLNALVHSIAFAPAEELKGEFADTSRDGFRIALDISVYSLVALNGCDWRPRSVKYTDLAALAKDTGFETRGTVGEPGFVDAAHGDYRLTKESAARAAGAGWANVPPAAG